MPTYHWDGSSWRTVNSIWTWDGSSWRNVNSAWTWVGSDWSQVFSSGTFAPILRLPGQTTPATARSVGLAIELFRGSTAAGSYAYQFQFAIGTTSSWTNETITGNSGTLTGATTTASFTTDSSYLSSLEAIAYSGNNIGILDDVDTYRLQVSKQAYIRARVIKSGETQFSNIVRIQKRQAINSGTLLRLRRASSGIVYTLTGNPATDRQPFVGDTIFWEPSFQNTTTLTNDTRPDYYWFSFDSNSGPNLRNSILSDPANPRNPVNSRSYTVQNSDINGPIVCNLRAINTNGAGTGDITIATRDVSDGSLTAPTNLILQYTALSLTGTWEAAGGGNDTTITYTWFLERSTGGAYTQIASGTTTSLTFSSSQTVPGNYRFYVTATQSGSPTVTSGFSNVFILQAPADFTVSIQNITNTDTYRPSVFSINAPTLNATTLNRWDWTWVASTITGPAYAKTGSFNTIVVNSWESQLTRPTGVTNNTFVSSATDFWTVSSSGNHTQTVTARNIRKNYVRISWTRPAGTSAVSYRVGINAYSAATNGSLDWSRTIDVEDITFVDIEHDYATNGTWTTGQVVQVTSLTAYNGPNQTGVSKSATFPVFNANQDGTGWTGCNVIGTRQTSRTDNLTLENPTDGTLITSGIPEPGETLSLTEGSGWSPSYANWSKTSYNWLRSRTVQPVSVGTASTQVVATTSTAVGSEYFCEVVANYKGTVRTVYSSSAIIVPGPPSYSLVDLANQTFRISSVAANGGTSFFGTYSGVSSGTIGETLISGGTFTSPTVNVGNISTTLFSRRYINQVYPTTVNGIQTNSTRSTVQNVSIATPPQSTGSRRFLNNVYVVNPGTFFYISTNGYLGLQSTTSGSSITIPTDGSWLNMAQADLRQQYLFTLADANGWWVRWRGNALNNVSQVLEYQVYYQYNTGTCYVNFVENSIPNYLAPLAWQSFGGTQSTWTGNSTLDNSSLTLLLGTGSMTRITTNDNVDDGVTTIQIIAPAVPMTSNPTVTRTAGGFTFNVTNAQSGGGVSAGQFESLATYGVLVTSGTGSATINASTGLVTVTGMANNSFSTVRVSKARTGYGTTTIDVTGQSLAGSPPVQTIAPTISLTGTGDTSGTVRRAQVGATVSGSAGTYNNQQSISSGLLTILSNTYTGADSNWTGTTPFATSTPVNTSAAASSANMYRWRDRVTGTDGTTVDFYTPVIYRAVYAPPPGSIGTITSNSITLNYTGGSGAPRYYRYLNGTELNFLTDGGAGPFVTTFTGLAASTFYTVQLFGGNTEGFLSVGFVGGTVQTTSGVVAPSGGTVTLSGGNTPGSIITASTSGWANSPTSFDVYITTTTSTSPPTSSDSRVASSGGGSSTTYTITSSDAISPVNRFRAFATATNSGGTGGPVQSAAVIVAQQPAATPPAITSGPSISWSSGNNFTLSATASNATNLEFEVEFANNNGGPALRTQTFFFGASTGGGQTGAQANTWARTRVRANNTNTSLSSGFSGYTGWV